MGGNIPGFQMLKDRVLKPLIVATEKVVEYYLNEDEKKPVEDSRMEEQTQTATTNEENPLQGQVNFNLSKKFERLLISEEVDLDMTFSDTNPKT